MELCWFVGQPIMAAAGFSAVEQILKSAQIM
jgi:hypothetical protein